MDTFHLYHLAAFALDAQVRDLIIPFLSEDGWSAGTFKTFRGWRGFGHGSRWSGGQSQGLKRPNGRNRL